MDRMRRLDLGAVVIGLILLAVGVYYLLENTFGYSLPELDWDKLWPLAVVAIGLGVLWRAWGHMGGGQDVHGA